MKGSCQNRDGMSRLAVWLSVLFVLFLAAVVVPVSAQSGTATYRAPDGSWSISYPASWEVSGSSQGRAAAFLAPAVQLGSARFRPSLVVSVSPVDQGVPEAGVVGVARAAFERSVQGAQLLGQESLRTSDGGSLAVLYYYARPDRRLPGLYFVVGVALRHRLYTMVGTTSTGLPDYRQQAAQMRAVMATLRAR